MDWSGFTFACGSLGTDVDSDALQQNYFKKDKKLITINLPWSFLPKSWAFASLIPAYDSMFFQIYKYIHQGAPETGCANMKHDCHAYTKRQVTIRKQVIIGGINGLDMRRKLL